MKNKDTEVKNLGGAPRYYKTPEELQEAIHEYFNKGVRKRIVLIGKKPNQEKIEVEVPTITGLCYYLGFESRQSFYDYEKNDGFSYTIKRARLFIEREYEEQLQIGNVTGAIFALKNFGWIDKSEIENKNYNYNSEKLTMDQVKELQRNLRNEYL